MKKNKKLFLAPALLLLVAVLAGCSQNDDALPAGTAVAQGGEPLNIRIAPKPGYAECANTRATVNNETGAFAWETGDAIRVRIIFNDAANTTLAHTWYYGPPQEGFSSYVPEWGAKDDRQSGRPMGKLVWPLGASSVTVNAFYGDMSTPYTVVGEGLNFAYNLGETGDYMLFSKTLSLGEGLTVDFAHGTTRLVFTGLAASTAYKLKAAGAELTFPKHLTADFTTFDVMEAATFTSDASGNLTVCADLDEKIDSNGKLKLELVKDGETTAAYQTTLTAQGTTGAYKIDGYIYKIKVGGTGGEVHPGKYPDLIIPAPIIPGNAVWELNDFYITAPDADLDKRFQWSADPSATVMANDPCAGHGNWRLPTMKDFEKIAGWTETWPWSQGVGSDLKPVSNEDMWYKKVFGVGGNRYWSSDVYTADASQAWVVESGDIGAGSDYSKTPKTEQWYVRCVQPK